MSDDEIIYKYAKGKGWVVDHPIPINLTVTGGITNLEQELSNSMFRLFARTDRISYNTSGIELIRREIIHQLEAQGLDVSDVTVSPIVNGNIEVSYTATERALNTVTITGRISV